MVKRISLKIFASSALITGLFLLTSGQAFATTFNANEVIDDQIFDNTTSLNTSQVNTFLNQFTGSCISPNKGFAAPDVTGYSPTNGFTYGGNVSAGTVITHAAQAYGINPQVLLSTIQKEQSLVTGGGGCSTLSYAAAAGYGCPDGGTTYHYTGLNLYTTGAHINANGTASGGTTTTSVSGTCVNTSSKAGFSQQVVRAAWLLKFGEQRSEGNESWNVQKSTTTDSSGNAWVSNWNNSDDPQSCYGGPMTQGTWQTCPNSSSVYYDGYTTIDSTSVHMNTGATAALYYYTPHLSGNENFESIFTSWFGPTLTSGFSWQYMGQNAYTDSSKATAADLTNFIAGSRYYLTVQAKNIGTQTWTQGVVNLGTDDPINRSSSFYDSTWPSADRAATLDQASVAPGQTGSFSFWVTAPSKPGTYKEYFDPVADGYSWMNEIGLYWQFTVMPQTYTWQYMGQNAYTDSSETTEADSNDMLPGSRYYLTLQAKNTGNQTWYKNEVNLGTDDPINRSSSFYDSTWPSADRAATLDQASVAPGQTGSFSFWVDAPRGGDGGTYKEYFVPVADGHSWMNEAGLFWQLTVPRPQYTWQYMGQNAYTDSSKATAANLSNITPGQRIYLTMQLKNTGNAMWYSGELNLGTDDPINRSSSFYDSTWPSADRAATLDQASVAPGQTGSFSFWVTAPSKPGTYKEYFDPVADGVTWLTDYGLYWQVTV